MNYLFNYDVNAQHSQSEFAQNLRNNLLICFYTVIKFNNS